MQALCRVVAPAAVACRAAATPTSRQNRRRGPAAAVKLRTRTILRATETEEPTEADFAVFNSVVGGGAWESVQAQVRAAAVEGKITPGVLGAAYTAGSHSVCVCVCV
jgi:hypothetical protein